MKKTLSIILAVLMVFALFTGCGKKEEAPESIRIGGLKGPTSMGMVKLLDDNEQGLTKNKYDFTMAAAAPELTPLLIKGELDILAVPANLAPTLYNNTEGEIQMLAINTLGVIYIAEKGTDTIKTMADLKGKTIYATGKGQTPEFCLQYLLAENGLTMGTDVVVEWKSEPTEVVATIAKMDNAVAMLPQPFVTVAQNSVEGLKVALSLTEEWDKLENGSTMLTGAVLVRKDFAEQYPQTLKAFLEEYAESTAWINENVEEGAALVEKYDIVKAAIAKKAIPFCNITCITGDEMATTAEGYLNVLLNANPTSVGGSLPGEDLYCIIK